MSSASPAAEIPPSTPTGVHQVTIKRLFDQLVSMQGIIGWLCTLIFPLGSWIAHQITSPIACQVCYCASTVHFPKSQSPFAFLQYEVLNPGPGSIEDVKIVAVILPAEKDLMVHSAMPGGYKSIIENGTVTEIIVGTTSDVKAKMPLVQSSKIGMEIAVVGDVGKVLSLQNSDPKIGVFLRRDGYEDQRITEQRRVVGVRGPYIFLALAGIPMALMVVVFSYNAVYKQVQFDSRIDKEVSERLAIARHDEQRKTSRTMSESSDIATAASDAVSAIEEKQL